LSMDYVDSAVLSFCLSGASPLHRSFGVAVNLSHLASQTSAASLQRNPALPPCLTAVWQQTRHGSFFNKLTAEELWRGVLAESGAGARKGRGKRTKRKLKRDLNRGQKLGEGRGGFLWPGLNTPVIRDGTLQSMSRRGEAEQQEVQADLGTARHNTHKHTLHPGLKSPIQSCLGPPDPGPNGGKHLHSIETVFNMTAKEGRKRSISCLVAVGNGNGAAGSTLININTAKNRAIHYLYYIERYNNDTIYHDIESKFKRTTLRMKKQNEGYGLHCHRAVITLCKLIGIKDMYCKVEGSVNLLNITRALFTGLANQETHQVLANKKQLHVVEFQSQRGPLPMVVASPKDGTRSNPDTEDEIPNTRLHWDDVRAAQGLKRSVWAGVKRTIW
uniref:Small ribosomal subunit protein uS5m n=1 Tax=Mola mola TaxID=94237 RepID=A0A3Q3WBY1_MOLML